MERSARLLRQIEFQVLCFCFGLVLFNWPLLGMSWLERPQCAFIWLFLLWAILIFLLFLIGRAEVSNTAPVEGSNDQCSIQR